jgi:hypothetical protein
MEGDKADMMVHFAPEIGSAGLLYEMSHAGVRQRPEPA